MKGHPFEDALVFLKDGERVRRTGWNGAGQYVGLCKNWNGTVTADDVNFTMLPFLYLRNAQGNIVPWLASQGDLLADDWEMV